MKIEFLTLQKFFNGAIIGFTVAVVVSLFSSINTIIYINRMYDELKILYEKDLIGQNHIQTARIDLIYLDREVKDYLLADKDKAKSAAYRAEADKYQNDYFAQISEAEKSYNSNVSFQLFTEARNASIDYFRRVNSIFYSSARDGRSLGDSRATVQKIDDILNKLDDFKQRKDLRTYQNIIREHEVSVNIILILLLATIIIRIAMLVNHHKKSGKEIKMRSHTININSRGE